MKPLKRIMDNRQFMTLRRLNKVMRIRLMNIINRWMRMMNWWVIVWFWMDIYTRSIKHIKTSISINYLICMKGTYTIIRLLSIITIRDGYGWYSHGPVLVRMNRDATILSRLRNQMRIDMNIWLFNRKKHWIEGH